jgi:2-methylaconitate cis-trans-isomerase PrpF
VIDDTGNCGNTSAVVGPFALLRGLIHPVEPVPKVRIYNTNTKKVILAEFLVENGEFISEEIFGLMALQAAAPRSFSISSARESVTGKLLPTGKVREEVKFPKLGTLEVSMADAANPFVFIRARDLRLKGNENIDEFSNNEATLKKCQAIRLVVAEIMGIAKTEEATTKRRFQRSPGWLRRRPIQLQRVRWSFTDRWRGADGSASDAP